MSGWIDIREREPENFGNVLVSVKLSYSVKPVVMCCWFNKLKRRFTGLDAYPYMSVTHWMPLPEPPEERKTQEEDKTGWFSDESPTPAP